MSSKSNATSAAPKRVRCAIYTRKSTEEGLQQEFNTLDAQRESAEAYVAAQRHEGWVCVPDRYDDGGFTGGNLDRPAVRRLLADIAAGKVDCVVVYKVDRLSRSLLDFSRIMETFDKYGVSFVSVTQQFNTTHSMGRLTLNILLSFAQFEREIISERTRDKIAAARRKGKFAGGRAVLGYDVQRNPGGSKLVVNEDEATRVRRIFELYLKHEALIPVVRELNKRGWTTKAWTTKAGQVRTGRRWGKTELFHLLTNVIYRGQVRYKQEVHPGEQPAVVDEGAWTKVQALLQRNRRTGGALVRNKHGALLKGILRCGPCSCSMGHTYSRQGSKLYRYYVCLTAQKQGWNACPSKSVPAGEIEAFVVDQVRKVGRDPAVLAVTLEQVRTQEERLRAEAEADSKRLARELGRLNAALAKATVDADAARAARLQEEVMALEAKAREVTGRIAALDVGRIEDGDVAAALGRFDPVWETLSPREQARIIRLLVERVDYDGKAGTVAVTFRPSGIKTLSEAGVAA